MSNKHKNPPPRRGGAKTASGMLVIITLLIILVFIVYKGIERNSEAGQTPDENTPSTGEPGINEQTPPVGSVPPSGENGDAETQDPGLPEFKPYSTDGTTPSRLISGTDILLNGQVAGEYLADDRIDFGPGEDYSALRGVITFRGNNFRDSPAFGFAELTEKKFAEQWGAGTGSLADSGGNVWTGNGWTGQPLIVSWPRDTRANMTNMYDWAREKDELVEVIYPSMDGYIYFMELSSGSKTRDALFMGFTFKGTGSLDPRGYPLLYVGSGLNSAKGNSRVFVISLLDGSVLYEFGTNETFAHRSWHMFDAAPLIDAETDKLIYAGENGLLYIIKLNTDYDPAAGTLTVDPSDTVKWRYSGTRSSSYSYWYGFENSPAVWRGHVILADNGGILMCLDLNTLQVDWVQDVLDDTNSSPVLELEDGHPYIYISTSYHYGWRGTGAVPIPIWKIDAVTGEIVWRTDYSCYSVDGTSGGVQGTIALGKNSLDDLIFVPVARTPGIGSGYLVALDKKSGDEIWKLETSVYSWSSPVAVYDAEGRGYIIYCTSGGYIYLLDGLTGERLDSMDLGSNIEASPAVYESFVVVGTRGQRIWGLRMT